MFFLAVQRGRICNRPCAAQLRAVVQNTVYMSLRMVNKRHIRLISLYWIRYAVRSGAGLVFLMIALLFGLSAAQSVVAPIELMIAHQTEKGHTAKPDEIVATIVRRGRPIIQWVLGSKVQHGSVSLAGMQQFQPSTQTSRTKQAGLEKRPPADQWTSFLLDERPALLSVIFFILMFGMPLLIPFIAFNQISGDAQTLGLRYVLLRTERVNIFLGRFLGTAIFSVLVMALIIVTIALYLAIKVNIYPTILLAAWSLRGFVTLAILILPYIALCSWISASVDSSFFSLTLSNMVIGGVLLGAYVGRLAWEPAIYLKYALPWGLQNHLLHPELTHSVGTALACLGYTAVFLLLGCRHFEKRDL